MPPRCGIACAAHPRTGRRWSLSRGAFLEEAQPSAQLAAPDAQFAVGEFDALWRAAEFAPAEEGSAGHAAEFVEDLIDGEELIAGGAHLARPP